MIVTRQTTTNSLLVLILDQLLNLQLVEFLEFSINQQTIFQEIFIDNWLLTDNPGLLSHTMFLTISKQHQTSNLYS